MLDPVVNTCKPEGSEGVVLETGKPIGEHFPFPTFRPFQADALKEIEAVFRSGKRVIFLEAPTGAGKSPMAIAAGRWAQERTKGPAALLTPQKILMDQYLNDWPDLADVRGRSAYECNRVDPYFAAALKQTQKGMLRASEGFCKMGGKGSLPDCRDACPYFVAVDRAVGAPFTLFNFSSYLHQRSYTDNFNGYRPSLMVLDEAHNVELELMKFSGLEVSDAGLPFKLKPVETAVEAITQLTQVNFKRIIEDAEKDAMGKGDAKAITHFQTLSRRFRWISKAVHEDAFIVEFTENPKRDSRKIEFKPLYVKRFAGSLLTDHADRLLFMSATILDAGLLVDALGLDPAECAFIRLGSTFPVANRPIYYRPVGAMSYRNREATLPKMVEMIARLMQHHGDHRGIIHCQSFWLGDRIREGLPVDLRKRLIYQKDLEKSSKAGTDIRAKALKVLGASANGVLLAPAFHEGIDLHDDLSRFQIIPKVPFPDLNSSKQLAARAKENWGYYQWLTALKLVQSVGRSVRSETDWAHTYILDADFEKFLAQAKPLLPSWFVEAIRFD